ncbi:hypothetical protein M422DRAFT_244471 [Sphaerobolus stellatus SS14]|nr:hypothetical protein M422DRAFT_244471 [Sphaerobolus stellatus SS14]
MAYIVLANFFIERGYALESIEIIPDLAGFERGSSTNPYDPLLYVDGHLGIPEKFLYKAYLSACRKFRRMTPEDLSQLSVAAQAGLVANSAIILFANPAHNTALNLRKSILQHQPSILSLSDELRFTACLLSNKPAAKSSLLWHHRRWILRHFYAGNSQVIPEDIPDTLIGAMSPEDVQSEFKLVSLATEVYPRNYHAWLHRNVCSDFLISQVSSGVANAREVLIAELDACKKWINLHISDYTAMHYLSTLFDKLESLNAKSPFNCSSAFSDIPSQLLGGLSQVNPILSHAFSLLTAYPTHEALWLYLRLGYAHQVRHNSDNEPLHVLKRIAEQLNSEDGSSSQVVNVILQQASTDRERDKLQRESSRFIEWTMKVGIERPTP